MVSQVTGLRPKMSRCMLTGALLGSCQTWGDDQPFSDKYVHMLQDRLQGVQLAGGTPEIMNPVKDSYKYLGVDFMKEKGRLPALQSRG